MATTYTYNVQSLDVWGNDGDGFEVNAAYRTDYNVEIPEDATDDDIAVILIDVGLLQNNVTGDDLTIEGEPEYMLCIYASKTYEPLWNLDRICD